MSVGPFQEVLTLGHFQRLILLEIQSALEIDLERIRTSENVRRKAQELYFTKKRF